MDEVKKSAITFGPVLVLQADIRIIQRLKQSMLLQTDLSPLHAFAVNQLVQLS